MEEIKKYLSEYDVDKFVFNISADFTLPLRGNYLDVLFQSDEKVINYNNFSVQVNECFYNRSCCVYKPELSEKTKKKLSQIIKVFFSTNLLDDEVKLICEFDNEYVIPKFYALPIRNKDNDYSLFIIPKEVIDIKGINYENELSEYNKIKKLKS